MTDSTRTWFISSADILGEGRHDILVKDGVIAAIGDETRNGAKDARRVDADGLIALPGLVDIHMHLRQPGQEDAEIIETGIRAAVTGGYTAVHAMASTTPVADAASVVDQVWEIGHECGWVEVRPVGAVTKGLKSERLSAMGAMANSRTKVRVFSDDGKCVSDPVLMRRTLEYIKTFDGVVAQHSQDLLLTEGAQMNESPLSGELGLSGWPAVAEEAIIARDILLTKHIGSRVHVCHLSIAGSVEFIRWGKKMGVKVTAETTPHHLFLTEELARSYDPLYKVNPPSCTAEDVEAVRQGLADGTIDVVGTDHAPHPLESKDCEWQAGAFGMTRLETTLPILIETMVNMGRMTWADIAHVLSTMPAKIGRVSMQGQGFVVGALANITLVDPLVRRIVDPATQQSHSSNSPYRGMELPGQVLYTLRRGESTVLAGELISKESH